MINADRDVASDEESAFQRRAIATVARWIPAVSWIAGYRRDWLRHDLVAGITMAAVVTPQAMGYATLAGLPVQAGLATAILPPLAYAMLGGSYRLSVSTTSTLSLLTAAGVRQVHNENPLSLAVTLALMAGGILVVSGLLRLGFVAAFVSHPMLIGFKIGIAVMIAWSQIGPILGIPITNGPVRDHLLTDLELVRAHLPAVGVAVTAFVFILLLRGKAPTLPGPLLAVGGSIGAGRLGIFADHPVATIGALPQGLPTLALPHLSVMPTLVAPALGIALMTLVESTAAARTVRKQEEPLIDANHELVALGVAAVAGSFAGAYASGGGLSQSEMNEQVGARTQVASMAAAGMVALTLLFLTPLLAELPVATLSAIVLVAAVELFDARGLRLIDKLSHRDGLVAVMTVGFVVYFGILVGLIISVTVSMIVLLYELNHPAVVVLGRDPGSGEWRNVVDFPRGQTPPGFLVVQPRGPLYFANARAVSDHVLTLVQRTTPPPTVVLIDGSEVSNLDVTMVFIFAELDRVLARHGANLWFAQMHSKSRRLLQAAMDERELPDAVFFPDLNAAWTAFKRQHIGD